MAGEKQKPKEKTDAPALAMANRFSKYKPEVEKAVRKLDVVEDNVLKQLKDAWRSFTIEQWTLDGYGLAHRAVGAQHPLVPRLPHSASDVEKFSIALAEFQDENCFSDKAGYFLSALVNCCKDMEFIIPTAHLAKPINYLGYANKKIIAVKGDVGHQLGANMCMGEIHVEGKIGSIAGTILGGKIYHRGVLIVDK